ncbi:MAG: hypothetical protein ACLPRE_02335 [Limisphaerales bacterium]
MSEKDNFALVPRPPSGIEKAEPGAKRVLSSMVADTLALTKPVFTVLLGDSKMHGEAGNGLFANFVELVIKSDWEKCCSLKFAHFKSEAELWALIRVQPFDLIFLYVSNVEWESGNPITTKNFNKLVEVLTRIKTRYNKPIVATQGVDLTESFEGTGVIFLTAPFNVEEFREIVRRFAPQRSSQRTMRHLG